VAQRHKGSLFGGAWAVVTPLLMMLLYSCVFGIIFGGRYGAISGETGVEYALGIFLSLTIFQLVAEILGTTPTTILSQANLVKKVVFPLEILPVAAVGTALFNFSINLCLVLLAVAVFGSGLTPLAFLLPLVIIPVILLCLGLAWWLSALGVFLRDITQITGFFAQILMYASAVFYSTTRIPENFWVYVRFNPLVHLIEIARDIVLWAHAPDWNGLGYAYLCGALCFSSGWLVFSRLKPAFADVL
jgi:lipopolysaccharide transport system permease protein